MVDHYSTLGVPHDASTDVIEAAWRREVKLWHPDYNRSDEASKRLRDIHTARRVLSNPSERRRYDRIIGIKKATPTAAERMQFQSQKTASAAPGHSTGGLGIGTRSAPSKQEPGSDYPKETSDTDWWNRFTEIARANAEKIRTEARIAAAERDRADIANIIDRRPWMARYVLIPAGIAAIIAAAAVTIILV